MVVYIGRNVPVLQDVRSKIKNFIGEETLEHLAEPSEFADSDEEAIEKHSAEKMEEVLNQGMGFISGLLEMAIGKKLGVAGGNARMVTLDKKPEK